MIDLRINTEIYSISNVNTVKEVYKDYAKIKTTKIGNILVLSFYNCRYDEKRTIKEFENYLIGVENSYGNS